MEHRGTTFQAVANPAFEAARARLANHPDAKRHSAATSLAESLDVFHRNSRDIVALLEASASEELGFELVQNVRPPVVRDEFMARLAQALHNFLASSQSLLDHCRISLKHVPSASKAALTSHLSTFASTPDAAFVKDLRNFTLHQAIPPLMHHISMNRNEEDSFETVSTSAFPTAALVQRHNWRAESREVLEESPDHLPILPIIQRFVPALGSLAASVHDSIMTSIDFPALDALVDACNAALMNTTSEQARSFMKEHSARLQNNTAAD